MKAVLIMRRVLVHWAVVLGHAVLRPQARIRILLRCHDRVDGTDSGPPMLTGDSCVDKLLSLLADDLLLSWAVTTRRLHNGLISIQLKPERTHRPMIPG